ncbi:MAG: methyltransferase domain-containing protein [Ardenticatenaceae bacterium]|nr:methyltransferase domain-containing protein [Ardenticatenaceae bacterium]
MRRKSPYSGTIRHVRANWPGYLLVYAGIVLALLLLGLSMQEGWLSFVPLSLALALLLGYLLAASLWAAHRLYDQEGLRPYHVLFDMGQLKATDTFVYVDLGVRDFALQLSRRLTSGKIFVVDVYNPQWTLSASLKRYRAGQPHPPPDPRLVWQNGRFDLLPLPDKSVSTVILHRVVSEFWQQGDRMALLAEVHRILTPNGRVLLAERTRSQTNWLVMGPSALNLRPADDWRELLQKAGFIIVKETDLQGLITCWRADKPTPAQARQLSLNLPL